MKLEFSGAALGVTGSKHLLTVNGKKILMDCGLFQGRRLQSIKANMTFPFDPAEIDAVVLSHAHIDHSGALPALVKNGFSGPIFCTHATRDLCTIMLKDSGYIQEKDAEWLKKKLKDKSAEPLYTIADAEKSITQFRSVNYDQTFRVVPGVNVTFHDAGHLLGSAMVEWDIVDDETHEMVKLGFTGDLGRHHLPILKNPEQLKNLDVLITESTYGDRFHDEIADVEDKFAEKVNETIKRGGKIFIPAFAVERTQEILYVIRELQHKKKLPQIPIFVDSPLAANATEIFRLHPECFDDEMREMAERGQAPFLDERDGLQFTRSVEDSKALNDFPGSAIILSASGMCEAGRIRHHLKNNISNPKNTILIVGFMAQNTLGRKIVEGESPVNIYGIPHEVRADVVIFNAFSGHADQKGLLKFAENCGTPKQVFCVHGEESQIQVFQTKLGELPNLKTATISAPTPGENFEMQRDKVWKKLAWVNPVAAELFAEPAEAEKK
ncbi:MBL fold metallo-hydrolase [bacterium]|jgi:metallo-beta-lactamase family protein|nr:MBL fold metallo-hydrolase [bacterium]MBT6831702.1 MBL fold metallo-hydrolase [bacterium]MBT6996682.1 MBL fold metallo-hydrolase [bacterium]MBT7772851.1 MBL fold metallo-hydrolase [bacterium]